MLLLSAAHFRPDGLIGMLLTRRASPPAGAITYTCGPSSVPRLLVNAMCLPSGDHFGLEFLPSEVVSCRCSLPSVESSQICDVLSSFSVENDATSTATHFPSGETLGGPTRLSFHRSATVI